MIGDSSNPICRQLSFPTSRRTDEQAGRGADEQIVYWGHSKCVELRWLRLTRKTIIRPLPLRPLSWSSVSLSIRDQTNVTILKHSLTSNLNNHIILKFAFQQFSIDELRL